MVKKKLCTTLPIFREYSAMFSSKFSIDFLITFVKLLHYELSNEEDKSINQTNKQKKIHDNTNHK